MGMWDFKPWDNDTAADWFANMFDEVKLREKVRTALESDVVEYGEEIRAAASILVFLGRVYVWPISEYEDDLKLAIDKLEEIKLREEIEKDEEYLSQINNEIEILKHRLDKNHKLPDSEEFDKWWLSLMG